MLISLRGRIVATAGASGAVACFQDKMVSSVTAAQVEGDEPNDLIVKPMVNSRLAPQLGTDADAYSSIDFNTLMVR